MCVYVMQATPTIWRRLLHVACVCEFSYPDSISYLSVQNGVFSYNLLHITNSSQWGLKIEILNLMDWFRRSIDSMAKSSRKKTLCSGGRCRHIAVAKVAKSNEKSTGNFLEAQKCYSLLWWMLLHQFCALELRYFGTSDLSFLVLQSLSRLIVQ